MLGFEDIKDLVLSNTMYDLEIRSCVIEVPICPGICSTLLYDFIFLHGGKIPGKLPCSKIIGYICIPR